MERGNTLQELIDNYDITVIGGDIFISELKKNPDLLNPPVTLHECVKDILIKNGLIDDHQT